MGQGRGGNECHWEPEIIQDLEDMSTCPVLGQIKLYPSTGSQLALAVKKVKESEVAQWCPTLRNPWTVAHQAPPSMGFCRQEYWSRLPFLSPEDLPDPGIEPRAPTLQADALVKNLPAVQET